jgi:hypothetical protein
MSKPAPAAYIKVRQAQQAKVRAAAKQAKTRDILHRKEESEFYRDIRGLLSPYHDTSLGKVKVKVKHKKKILESWVYFNGKHFLTFRTERHWNGRCGCDNVCSCPPPASWPSLRVVQHKGDASEYHCWFSFVSVRSTERKDREEAFAKSMLDMVREFIFNERGL